MFRERRENNRYIRATERRDLVWGVLFQLTTIHRPEIRPYSGRGLCGKLIFHPCASPDEVRCAAANAGPGSRLRVLARPLCTDSAKSASPKWRAGCDVRERTAMLAGACEGRAANCSKLERSWLHDVVRGGTVGWGCGAWAWRGGKGSGSRDPQNQALRLASNYAG